MAVIGNLHSLSYLFSKTLPLQELYTYLCNATNPQNAISKRILAMKNGEEKFDIGFGMIAIEQTYFLKNPKNAFYESHIKYVDFQLIIKGEEYFHLGDPCCFTIQMPYDEKRDLISYAPQTKNSNLLLKKEDLAIFFKHDIHAGGLYYQDLQETNQVYKTVVKVPQELLKLKL